MSVNFEVKGYLAKLLATEDLVVEHKNCETAQFNVETRVLTLPMWNKASNDVYTMLVLHEVSHALWTPNVDWTVDYKVPVSFVNIVEDVRVEKLCKRKYPGSPKSFYRGYKELSDQDFFSLENEDISKMNLADRVNLFYKIGNFVNISFDEKEFPIVELIEKCETFDDTLYAAKVLYEYCKEETNQNQENTNSAEFSQQQSGDFQDDTEDATDSEEQQEDSSVEKTTKDTQDNSSNQQEDLDLSDEPSSSPEVKTDKSLQDSIQKLNSKSSFDNAYVELPKLDLNKIIVSNEEIHKLCKEQWSSYEDFVFESVDSDFQKFKKFAQKEVNYLVKEFECRKAADSYARASTARTGVLDCTKLYSYKYNEDIFKKVTTLSDGKNHGLIFILDWSGSMDRVMLDTIKQLYNLIWFCKKVSIPFELYAFTNSYPTFTTDGYRERAYTRKENVISVDEWFSLMNLLSSKTNAKTLNDQMRTIFRIANYFSRNWSSYYVPKGMDLSGTPLNESLIALHEILPKFQKENKLQKVQCVILTDGEGGGIAYHKKFERQTYYGEDTERWGSHRIGENTYLRDRKIGNTYNLAKFGGEYNYYGVTDVLLLNLRDKFPNTNFIGIRVVGGRESSNFIARYEKSQTDFQRAKELFKKQKSYTIHSSGYHKYFALASNALSQEVHFDVEEHASKARIKSAFMKSLNTKKMNKKVLNEFMDLVV
jgi:hypothetical protein